MPKYYCDYCDKYLTHDSPSVRKSHTTGKQHNMAVQLYYQQFEADFHQEMHEKNLKELASGKMPIIPQFFPPGLLPVPYFLGPEGAATPPGLFPPPNPQQHQQQFQQMQMQQLQQQQQNQEQHHMQPQQQGMYPPQMQQHIQQQQQQQQHHQHHQQQGYQQHHMQQHMQNYQD
ncbi:C2H2-type zinc finger-containing protein [Tieghemostelium lacteum]|uniref:U1 small nuclear ribonucleoprotein C n=1 Tax=Tieghemostelium lacteum TaxID=361077 RepID=A0A151Z9M7_TIELA|nr:C2H2-type zinc finger-containing protein [Tieghemostelium lacteum]|eukprot:KYQ90661.1 C2H2-type zinc finger-containing protein [Tieghemostelium lacteum]